MRHYVLTRSAYGPAWELDANRRRLEITRAVTARLMAAQRRCDWTWVVLLDERDPLLEERLELYRSAAPRFRPIVWAPPDEAGPADALRQRIAAADYRAPWRDAIGPADELILTTRIDDDDGFAIDALLRYQVAARRVRRRAVLMLPIGVRVWAGRQTVVPHHRNAMHTLVAPPGDALCVYDYGHIHAHRAAPVLTVDSRWGWLWVRHRDTISGHRMADRPIDSRVRRTFPVDWPALEAAWR